MAQTITLSAAVRQNLLSLQGTADQLSITQNRLATQKKVNSALDNPTAFFTATALSSRANDLSALLDSMANGINTVKAADTGLTAITGIIQSMQATVTQARQDSTWESTSFTLDTVTIGSTVLKNISFAGGAVTGSVNIALNTVGTNGTVTSQTYVNAYAAPATAAAGSVTGAAFSSATAANLITITYTPTTSSGSLYTNGSTATYSLAVTLTTNEASLSEAVDKINAAILLDSTLNGKIQATASAGALRITSVNNVDANVTATQGGTGALNAATTVAGSDGLTAFTVNGTAVSVNTSTGANLAAAINALNVQLLAASSAFEAYDAGSSKLGIREKIAQGAALTIAGPDAGLFDVVTAGTAATNGAVNTVDQLVALINANVNLTNKVTASNDAGQLRIKNLSTSVLNLTGASGTTIAGTGSATIGGNTVRNNLITQFNQLRDQLDKTAGDSSFNGINLLNGDSLKLFFNETSTSSLTIVATNASGINNSVLGVASATGTQFSSGSLLDTLSAGLATALTTVASQSAAFGSNLTIVQNRQEFTKNLINTLQGGASQLTLADTNEEGANMLALQTRQQLSITALSLASQANQAVLRLFG